MNFGSGFGSSSTSSFSQQSSGAFGVFGAASGQTAFGAGASQPSLFGNATPSSSPAGGGFFSQSSTSQMFGTFGQQQPNWTFGGGSRTPYGGSGGGTTFGTPPGGSGAMASNVMRGTYSRAFERVAETTDSGSRDGARAFLMSMCAMSDYLAHQPEMLRAVDYKNGHKRSSGQARSPIAPGTGLFGSSGGFGSTINPTGGTGTSAFGGGSSGFRGGTSFGGGSTGLFGQTTPQASGSTFGLFGSSGTTFGLAASSGGFGSGFGASSGPSLFGGAGGTTTFGQQMSSGPLFGAQQSSGSSIFGNQPASGFGTTMLNQPPATGSNIFGQSPGSSIFGSGPSTFGGTGTAAFQSSGGSLFGSASSGGLFGSQSSGTTIFGQASSQPSAFGGFGAFSQSSTPFMGSAQPQTTSLFPQASQFGNPPAQPSGNTPLFGQQQQPSAPPQQQQQPNAGGYFENPQWLTDPSSNPNWTPEYGLVVPNLSLFSHEMAKKKEADDTTNPSQAKPIDAWNRPTDSSSVRGLFTLPEPRYPLGDDLDNNKTNKKPELEWDAFTLSRPPQKASLEEEIRENVEAFKKQTAEAVTSTGETSTPVQTSLEIHPGSSGQESGVQALLDLEEQKRARMQSVDGLTIEEIRALLPVTTKPGYYVLPSSTQLEKVVAVRGKDALKSLPGVEIGRTDYGKVCFASAVNLEKLNVDESIAIKRGRVVLGEGENPLSRIPATITLFKVFSKDKGKKGFLTNGPELTEEIERFRRFTKNMGADFISYDHQGTWILKVMQLQM